MAGQMPQESLLGKSFLSLSTFFFPGACAQRGVLGERAVGGRQAWDPSGLHARDVQRLPSRTPFGSGQGDSL